MADFKKDTVADMAADNPGLNYGTSGSLHEIDWGTEDAYWRAEHPRRPYATADRAYEFYRPAYRYGTESVARHPNREYADVEPELERGWHAARGESKAAWHEVKDAVRGAWERVRGRR